MKHLVVIALWAAACGGTEKKPPETIGNTGDPPAVAPAPAGVRGVIRDETGQPLIGATLVVVGDGLTGELVAITDNDGRYEFAAVPDGRYRLHIYYTDLTFQRAFTVAGGMALDQAVPVTGRRGGDVSMCTDATAASCKP